MTKVSRFLQKFDNITKWKSSSDNHKEMVTVLLPTFNRTRWLRESIESILKQSYQNIELLVVDDSATNEIEEICKKYKGNIKYFHRNQSGLASAFNFCIEHMNGEWLKIMASDDLLYPDAIETFVEYAHSSKAKILYPDVKYIDVNGDSMGTRIQPGYDDPDQFAEAFWLYQIVVAVSIFYHKSCFDIVGKFDENLIESFDYKWLLKAIFLHDYKLQHIPKILFKFRLHKEQISTEHTEQHLADVTEIRNEISSLMQKDKPEKWKSFIPRLIKSETGQAANSSKEHIPTTDNTVGTKFKCKICEHFVGKNSYFYLSPHDDSTTCGQCHTIFERKDLRT